MPCDLLRVLEGPPPFDRHAAVDPSRPERNGSRSRPAALRPTPDP